jgi:XTP/dITP diphosphohydrolase
MTEQRSALLHAVQIMDRLRSPGGCPWDAEQTHSSLAPYLIEEAYETLEAIETAELASLREELGDLLLQVLFHARLAEEAAEAERFGIEDVAADLVAKLTRRHPHVFSDVTVDSAAEVNANWDAIKQAEKQRESVTDGIPLGQPALALSAKLISRAKKAGLDVPAPAGTDTGTDTGDSTSNGTSDGIGEKLFAVVYESVQAGVDPEQALRHTARRFREAVRAEELRGRQTS